MRVIHRIEAIICLICMFFCLTGCADEKVKSKDTNVVSSIKYKGTEVSLPEDHFILSQVAANEDRIYVYGHPFDEESTQLKIHNYDLTGKYDGCFEIPKFSEEYRHTIMNVYADNDGNLWLLKYLSPYEYVNGSREVSNDISSWIVEEYNSKGELLLSFEVGDRNALCTNITADQEYVLVAGGDGLKAFDHDGKAVSSIADASVVTTFFDHDGQAYVVFNKMGKKQVGTLDIRQGKISASYEIPEATNRVIRDPDADYDFFIEMSGALYGVDKEKEARDLIADFVNYSIVHTNKGVIPLHGGAILIYNAQRIQIFTPSASDGPVVTLTLGTLDSRFLSDMVEKFNASSDQYEIKIVDYSQYNLSPDSSEGIMKLNTEIISGAGPDIFDLCSLPAAQYERAGMLVDLYPYMQSDDLTKDMVFVEPVMDVMETDGKLYQLIPAYSIMTLIGSDQYFEENALSFEQLIELNNNGKNPFFHAMSKQDFLACIMSVDDPPFINVKENSCDFNNERFIKALHFMSSLPDEGDMGNEMRDISSGDQILSRQYFSTYHRMIYYNYWFNGTMCFAGVPASQGAGAVVCPYLCFGISQNCRDKDGAWEFLKQYLLDDYQNLAAKDILPLPISQSALDLTEDRFRKWIDDGGEMWVGYDNLGKEVVLHVSESESDEAVKKMDALMSSVITLYNNDFKLSSLIWECISPFFSGEKTAEEVASNTQSKVSLFLAEQYG